MLAFICITLLCGSNAYSFYDFETTLSLREDGYESVWSTSEIDCDIDSYIVDDTFLQRYLGINEDFPYVLLTLKENVTNFDIHVWEEMAIVNANGGDTPVKEQINILRNMKDTIAPKIWKQPNGTNDVLELAYAPETLPSLSFVLYYTNSTNTNTIAMSQIIKATKVKYPDVSFFCWDLMISDGPSPFLYNPTLTVYNTKVHGSDLKELEQPFDEVQFGYFVEANIGMMEINNNYHNYRESISKTNKV